MVITNNMKLLLLISLSGLVTTHAISQDDKDNLQKLGFVQFFIVENIILMGGENCSTKLSTSVRKAKTEAIQCIYNLDAPGSFCDSLVHDWVKCLSPLREKIEECNQNVILKGAIDASIATTISQADFICHSDVSNLLELANPCFLNSLESEEPCVNRFMIDIQSVFVTQKKLTDAFCKAAGELESCLTGTIEGNCPNKVTVDTIRGAYDATVKPCNIKKKKL